jgi:CheY-like chemotaxis protein
MSRVLVIEHNLAVRNVIKRLLECEGLAVTSIDSSELQFASFDITPFHLAIIDILLRDGEGLGTIKQLRQRLPDIPVVLLFGTHYENRELAAAGLGTMVRMAGTGYALARPFTPADLMHAVRRSLPGPFPGSGASADL